MEDLPELTLLQIISYLSPEDIQSFSLTCKRIFSIAPRFLIIKGPDFHIYGPHGGHFAPEPYFMGPKLIKPVKKLTISLTWNDQGWGNRKGDVFITLMRGSFVRGKKELATIMNPLGVAPHNETAESTVLVDHAIVSEAREGDYYKFTRNPGGGGGHQLKVKNYKVIVQY